MDGVRMPRYKVTGTQPILNHQPGETFEAKIPTDREAFLIAIGGITVVDEPKPVDKATKSADRS